ncbi:MAG TPA: helix-turn-helix domain-containing protein, partial [Terriglobales bacterium]|nr:helix-turn-helix domain-containing protein [Terriglobales bacterium]
RELENVLERAMTLCMGGVITGENIKVRAVARPAADTAVGTAASVAVAPTGSPLGDQLESMERDAILKALEKTRYNKTAAAKLLGMSFRALRYRIKKLGLE